MAAGDAFFGAVNKLFKYIEKQTHIDDVNNVYNMVMEILPLRYSYSNDLWGGGSLNGTCLILKHKLSVECMKTPDKVVHVCNEILRQLIKRDDRETWKWINVIKFINVKMYNEHVAESNRIIENTMSTYDPNIIHLMPYKSLFSVTLGLVKNVTPIFHGSKIETFCKTT